MTVGLPAGLLAMILAVIPGERNTEVVSVQMVAGAERSAPAMSRARALATQMFATAGIELEWCERAAKCRGWEQRIVVTLQTSAPTQVPASARADALSFQGRDISIYLDRMPPLSNPQAFNFWAHVLVHEITHLLQASDHHSEAGVMKAHWSKRDIAAMQVEPLPFTSFDRKMLHAGLEYRRSRRLVPAPNQSAAAEQYGQ